MAKRPTMIYKGIRYVQLLVTIISVIYEVAGDFTLEPETSEIDKWIVRRTKIARQDGGPFVVVGTGDRSPVLTEDGHGLKVQVREPARSPSRYKGLREPPAGRPVHLLHTGQGARFRHE